jgi:zinc/manganese transport system substrate-binding protein
VFDPMLGTLGLEDETPSGYQRAAANESEPGPADLAAFEERLSSGAVDVLIDNTQTEGAVPKQLRAAAERAGVPVVEISETMAPGATGFVDWQVGQLRALAAALGLE